MNAKTDQIKQNHLTTDDLAFSAYLRLQGYFLIKSNANQIKKSFVFDIGTKDSTELKVEFINSDFLSYYNELRNLKKLL